jgi:hypothetical protein
LVEFVLYYHWPNSSSLFDTISFCGLKVTVFVYFSRGSRNHQENLYVDRTDYDGEK